MALNGALVSSPNFGDQSIEEYRDFVSFFNEVKRSCGVSSHEDYVIPFMGHTKIPFRNRWWRALYGCGSTQEYPRLCFADSICSVTGQGDGFESLLRYVDDMVDALGGGGWDGEGLVEIGLHLPPEDYWAKVREWSMLDALPMDEVIGALSDETAPIERIHFFAREGITLPLFNPSLLEDYLDLASKELDDDARRNAVNYTIARQADTSFFSNAPVRAGVVEFPCFEVDGELLENCPGVFLLADGNRSITLFADDEGGDGNLTAVQELFEKRTDRVEIVEGVSGPRGRKRLVIDDPTQFDFTIVSYYDNSPTASSASGLVLPLSDVADVFLGAVDVVALLQMASSIEEINSFVCYLKTTRHKLLNPFSGKADLFPLWKANGGNVLAGAEDDNMHIHVMCDYHETDEYYRALFHETLPDFPSGDGDYVLGSPFAFTFEENERKFLRIRKKANGAGICVSKHVGDAKGRFVLLRVNLDGVRTLLPEEAEEEDQAYRLVEDILMLLVNELEDEIRELADALGGFACFEYAIEDNPDANRFELIDSSLGLRGTLIQKNRYPVVRFTLNRKLFFESLGEASDRSVECELASGVVSLFSSRAPDAAEAFCNAVSALSSQHKKVDVTQLKLPYSWVQNAHSVIEDDVSRAFACKAIATAAADADVPAGTFYGVDANEKLRAIQAGAVARLKGALGRYDAESLVSRLHEVIADSAHMFYVETDRFGAFGTLEDDERSRLETSTVDSREDARNWIRAARYCIETCLAFGTDGASYPTDRELANLLSLAGQIVNLCDDADVLHFDPPGMGIAVAEDSLVSLADERGAGTQSWRLKMRQLRKSRDWGGDSTRDTYYIDAAKTAFQVDVGFSFDCFQNVLDYLAFGVREQRGLFVSPNVVSVEARQLKALIHEALGEFYQDSELCACVDYLKVDPSALRTIGNESLDYLPFGREKDRPNRIELKPIVEFDGRLVFSTVSMGFLKERWLRGIAERFIPAKASFDSLYGVLTDWKRQYEKALEFEARDCFIRNGFNEAHVYKGLKLNKKNKRYPANLGDYDVLAYDERTQSIWVIECKEFEKVRSAYDFMQLQQRWFGDKGKLEKFERRIRYMKEHADEVADDFGFKHEKNISVRAFLVSNKIFANIIGESSFQVLSLEELDSLLSGRERE